MGGDMGKRFILFIIFAATIHSASFFAIAGLDEGDAAYKIGGFEKAFEEFKELADHGNASAQYSVGLMYARGDGVPKDYFLAYTWFNLAAAQGNDRARRYRNTCATQLTLSQIAEAERMAREWKPSK